MSTLMTRRRAIMMMGGEKSGLPGEYQQVEYIWYKGGVNEPYLDLGVGRVRNIYPLSFKFQIYKTGSGPYGALVFSSRNKISGGTNYLSMLMGSPAQMAINRTSAQQTVRSTYNTPNRKVVNAEVVLTETDCTFRFETDTVFSETVQFENNIVDLSNQMFVVPHTSSNSSMDGYIYFLIVEENGAPVINLIPCYRKSDSAVGMYDTVVKQFYTSANNKSFVAGPDVN